ncbi:hypothetical protein [Microbacterium sp. TNHR37B]|uniref:hypothetical protein n=1 Tax=Microbacterium sp. TNHR37B TaxID=1775956 RepID=UPI0007B1B297|nr:hypothetical protein [Microbacterium sp. TNHR37B]KZE89255.1 hypothetical protein AVP41_02048 [Microbacterium sp. TNHR37B]
MITTTDGLTDRPWWIAVTLWVLAVAVAAVGVAVAIASSSVWPLVAFAGLFLPMIPVGRRQRRTQSAPSVPR